MWNPRDETVLILLWEDYSKKNKNFCEFDPLATTLTKKLKDVYGVQKTRDGVLKKLKDWFEIYRKLNPKCDVCPRGKVTGAYAILATFLPDGKSCVHMPTLTTSRGLTSIICGASTSIRCGASTSIRCGASTSITSGASTSSAPSTSSKRTASSGYGEEGLPPKKRMKISVKLYCKIQQDDELVRQYMAQAVHVANTDAYNKLLDSIPQQTGELASIIENEVRKDIEKKASQNQKK